jgi:uncharacterized protein
MMSQFTFQLLPESYAVCKLSPNVAIPQWALGATGFLNITKTATELSIVCLQSIVPEGVEMEMDWRVLGIVGTLDFSMVGVLSAISGLLASQSISIFVISTFDTDYLLVKQPQLASTLQSLQQAGHTVR